MLRFDVAAETFALFRDAMNELCRRAGAALDDDSALLEMARCVLGGPRDEGRASYQVVLNVCPECGNGRQQANGGLVPLDPDVIRMACCDAQHIGPIADAHSAPANDLEPDDRRDEHKAAPDHTWPSQHDAHVGASTPRSSTIGPLSDHTDASAASEAGTVAGQAPTDRASQTSLPRAGAGVRPRAKQTIPPALRRVVLLRDQRRCQVPGCTNLTGLCSAHHRAAHRGKITLARSQSGALRVRHADGTEYGRCVKPQTLEVRVKVFSALRHLRFREAQVRAALEQLQRESALEQASFDGLLREALARLRSPGVRH